MEITEKYKNKENLEEIFTLKEVAFALKISESELRKLMAKGEIPYFEIGDKESKKKRKRFLKSDIDTYIKNNMKGSNIK